MKPRSRPVDELGADASPGTVQAVQRSLRLLLVLAEAPRPRTLQELSAIMDCSVSTVRRMLSTLSDVHLVEKEPNARFASQVVPLVLVRPDPDGSDGAQ